MNAYLDQIPAAFRLAAAARTDAEHWRTVFIWSIVGATLAAIWASRVLVRVRVGWEARIASEAVASLILAFTFALLVQVAWTAAETLANLWWPTGARLDLRVLLSPSPARVLIGAMGGWLLLTALRLWLRWGWAGLSGAAFLLIFGAVMVSPLALSPAVRGDHPAAGALTSPLLNFVRKGGLEATNLFAFDSADPLAVDMEGLGPFTHAAVSRAALAAPRPETYAAIGHLLGHYRHKDLWSLTFLASGFTATFFGLAWAVGAVTIRTSDQPALRDAARLPLIGLIGWGMITVCTPVFNLFDQAINYRADDYALSLTRDPDALCRWLIATEASGKIDPSPLEAVLFYDHPPLKPRLAHAQAWSATYRFREPRL